VKIRTRTKNNILKAYGEYDLAEKALALKENECRQLGIIAARYIGKGGYLSKTNWGQ
jgi:hypothetical protein